MGFFAINMFWQAILVIVIGILAGVTNIDRPVTVFADGVKYPAWPVKEFEWKDINNIILKDGMLTIDLKNNRIFQNLIEEGVSVDEKEFNEFCRQQLA